MIRKLTYPFILILMLVGCNSAQNNNIEAKTPQSNSVISAELAPAPSQNSGNLQVIGGDEQTLRAFIERWFAPMYMYGSSNGDVIIRLDEMPDDIPVELPLPQDTDFVASIQTPYDWQILFDVSPPAEDMLSLYAKILADANWKPAPENVQGGGFVSPVENWSVFCHDEAGVALTVQTYQLPYDQTGMRLTLNTKDIQYMCDPQGSGYVDQDYEMLPVLKTPSDALVTGGGSSSGGGTAESASDIKTNLTTAELNAYFSNQLETAKWSRTDGDDTDNFSWSSWETVDDQEDRWNGILIILKNPVEEGLLYAMMRVTKVSK
jgi:hypothetical protein